MQPGLALTWQPSSNLSFLSAGVTDVNTDTFARVTGRGREQDNPFLAPSLAFLCLWGRGVLPSSTHLLSLLCLPTGAREGCGTGPGTGGPAGASAAGAGTGSLGAPEVPSRTREPAPEVGTVAGGREGQRRKGWVLRFLLVGTSVWSSVWKLSCRQRLPVRRGH